MVFAAERSQGGNCLECMVKLVFELVWQRHVEHEPTFGAHQMMVMRSGDFFGELEAGMVGRRHDSMDDSGLFEHDQVSVGRALGESIPRLKHAGNRQRRVCGGEGFDKRSSIAGVALV